MDITENKLNFSMAGDGERAVVDRAPAGHDAVVWTGLWPQLSPSR